MRRLLYSVAGVAALWATASLAHQAPTGWAYPFACCSNQDCRVVGSTNRKAGTEGVVILERPEGYVISTTHEVIAYNDPRIKDSPDGEFHWCSVAGEVASRTICLFVPPRAF